MGEIGKIIVGQQSIIDQLLIALLCRGHCLLIGVPGLAKTLLISTLARSLNLKFSRIQFTPDLMPSDITGTEVIEEDTSSGRRHFRFVKGPIFANIILADEINRAPAKVQSALLEAMQERQVTIGDNTYKLDEPFLVLATQNPIEQEGTYPLPEAQVDRFMLMLKIGYPTPAEEREIMDRNAEVGFPPVQRIISPDDIVRAREVVRSIYVDEKVKEYIVNVVLATREPAKYGLADLTDLIAYGASPRATIYLNLAAKAHAFLKGRGYITPEDIKAIGHDVLRHRIIITYEAEAEEVTSDDIVTKIFDAVEVP
ncbi:MAG: AAA family ATPase [Candidatus Zixiibacteriota bacterium]